VDSDRQKRVSRGKSLGELIASGTFRADRHWRLVLEGSQPPGVPDHEWRKIVSQAKAHLRKKMGEERRAAERALLATDLTDAEQARYVAMVEELMREVPNAIAEVIEWLLNRSDYEKRVALQLGQLNPMDWFAAMGHAKLPAEHHVEPQEWVTT
jgi:hypothetical protein